MKRTEALLIGSKTYMPDKPCKNGHLSERYTRSGGCLACLRIGNPAPVDPTSVLPPLRMHPDDIKQVLELCNYLSRARGNGPLPTDPLVAAQLSSTPTPWEQYLDAALRQRAKLGTGPGILELIATAHALGIPETYRPGRTRPADIMVMSDSFEEAKRLKLIELENAAGLPPEARLTKPIPALPLAAPPPAPTSAWQGYTAAELEAMGKKEFAQAKLRMVNAGIPVPQLSTDGDGSGPRNPYA